MSKKQSFFLVKEKRKTKKKKNKEANLANDGIIRGLSWKKWYRGHVENSLDGFVL